MGLLVIPSVIRDQGRAMWDESLVHCRVVGQGATVGGARSHEKCTPSWEAKDNALLNVDSLIPCLLERKENPVKMPVIQLRAQLKTITRPGNLGYWGRMGIWKLSPVLYYRLAFRIPCSRRISYEPRNMASIFTDNAPIALVVDRRVPQPDRDAGSQHIMGIIKGLQDLGWNVIFVAADHKHAAQPRQRLTTMGVYVSDWEDTISRAAGPECGASVKAVVLSRYFLAKHYLPVVRKRWPLAKIIFNAEDLHYLRIEREAEILGHHGLKRFSGYIKQQELGVCQRVDHILVVSSREQELLLAEAPHLRVNVLPLIAEAHDGTTAKTWDQRRDILFVGGFRHRPNVDGVEYFLTEIWPKVRKKLPHVQLYIVGANPPQKFYAYEQQGVKTLGYVEDLEAIYAKTRLSIAPLRYGAGVKGKVVESLSWGVPVVATPTATEGLSLQNQRDILIGRHAEDFAKAVIQAYTDKLLWNTLSVNGVSAVQKQCSHAVFVDILQRVLRDEMEDKLS